MNTEKLKDVRFMLGFFIDYHDLDKEEFNNFLKSVDFKYEIKDEMYIDNNYTFFPFILSSNNTRYTEIAEKVLTQFKCKIKSKFEKVYNPYTIKFKSVCPTDSIEEDKDNISFVSNFYDPNGKYIGKYILTDFKITRK